jgi:hypothetical protein
MQSPQVTKFIEKQTSEYWNQRALLAARHMPKFALRLASYKHNVDGKLCCPVCHIQEMKTGRIVPRSGPDGITDVFQCRECGEEYDITS